MRKEGRKEGGNAIYINKATKQTITPRVITSQRDQAVTVASTVFLDDMGLLNL